MCRYIMFSCHRKEKRMKKIGTYYFSTLDQVILTFSDVFEVNYLEQIRLHFERPKETGFDIAEIILPTYHFTKVMGFTEDEVFELEAYAKDNAELIWELAREKGVTI